MQAASALYVKSRTVQHSPPTAIYQLASPKAATIREEVISRIEAGEYVGPEMVQQRFLEEREKERSAKISEKRRPNYEAHAPPSPALFDERLWQPHAKPDHDDKCGA